MLEFFYFETHFVIDQIEENVAVVEWENQSLSILDISLIPNPKEGHTYIFQAFKKRQSDCSITQNNPLKIACHHQEWVFPLEIPVPHESSWSVKNAWIAQPITWRIYELEPIVYYEESLPFE